MTRQNTEPAKLVNIRARFSSNFLFRCFHEAETSEVKHGEVKHRTVSGENGVRGKYENEKKQTNTQTQKKMQEKGKFRKAKIIVEAKKRFNSRKFEICSGKKVAVWQGLRCKKRNFHICSILNPLLLKLVMEKTPLQI